MRQHIKNYFGTIKNLLDRLDIGSVENAAKLIELAFYSEKNIYIIGNGGSAATASHIANDFSKGIKTGTEKNFKVISLTDNIPLITAISNDIGYKYIFVDQLKIFVKENDVVIGISASGNSENVVLALEYAKSKGAMTIAIVGFDGGQLKRIADVCVHVETAKGMYGPVEDIHMIIEHAISNYFIDRFKRS